MRARWSASDPNGRESGRPLTRENGWALEDSNLRPQPCEAVPRKRTVRRQTARSGLTSDDDGGRRQPTIRNGASYRTNRRTRVRREPTRRRTFSPIGASNSCIRRRALREVFLRTLESQWDTESGCRSASTCRSRSATDSCSWNEAESGPCWRHGLPAAAFLENRCCIPCRLRRPASYC